MELARRERNMRGRRWVSSVLPQVAVTSLLASFGSAILLLCTTTFPARSCAFVVVGPAGSRPPTPTRTGSSSRTALPSRALQGCSSPLSCRREHTEQQHYGHSAGWCRQESFSFGRRRRPRKSCLSLSAKARKKKDVSGGKDQADAAGAGTRLEDLALEDFVDLSGGRNTCLKRVDEPGDANDGNPAKGSKIKVQYTMRVLGGAHIGSSRDEGKTEPFEFVLGRWPSEATHGWDKAVSTMHKGEIATLVCGPHYAFGAKGAPPKIPPNATVETELELVDWLDLAVKYNAVPGKVETEEELRERWGEELADGTSPMRKEAGIDRKVQEELGRRQENARENMDHRGKKLYDVKSEEAQSILAQQKVQGYTRDFGYVEKAKYLDLYIPVPKGTGAKDVTCDIHPDRMVVEVEGAGVVAQGMFEGKVALDGCYWLMTDLSLDSPESMATTKGGDVRQGPRKRGDTCVQVFLEKRKPFDTVWQHIFASENDGETNDQ